MFYIPYMSYLRLTPFLQGIKPYFKIGQPNKQGAKLNHLLDKTNNFFALMGKKVRKRIEICRKWVFMHKKRPCYIEQGRQKRKKNPRS